MLDLKMLDIRVHFNDFLSKIYHLII